jgi:hypothetical protein
VKYNITGSNTPVGKGEVLNSGLPIDANKYFLVKNSGNY